jgi:hypothetical protein
MKKGVEERIYELEEAFLAVFEELDTPSFLKEL